jgi:methylase of polypeptide subunit release factors
MSNEHIQWSEQDISHSALWRSERGVSPPKRVQIADDTMSADTAYKLATEGVGLLWRGDFHNAKHLIQALERRLEKRSERSEKRPAKRAPRRGAETDGTAKAAVKLSAPTNEALPADIAAAFYRHRQTQAQRARILNMVLLPFDADYGIPLRRAPDARLACQEAWGAASSQTSSEKIHSVASLRELLGIISAHEWRKKGVVVPALGRDKKAVERRIHAHYGVFSPVRGEYIDLVEQAPLPTAFGEASQLLAFDIGTGTGVLSALLAMRGVGQIVATDVDARALACARENLSRLVKKHMEGQQIQLVEANLFPDTAKHGLAHLIVCNPPWLPGKPSSALEGAIYDEGSQMLKGFLQGLSAHLSPGGEAWLILSDLAEHLGLRAPGELPALIKEAGLQVIGQSSTSPKHPKANDVTDSFFAARSREKTHLWRLALA